MKIQYRLDGQLHEVSRIEHVPQVIDNLIAFLPDYPPDPHTEIEHAEMERLNDVFAELMRREKRCQP
jgi:hypothetical protein